MEERRRELEDVVLDVQRREDELKELQDNLDSASADLQTAQEGIEKKQQELEALKVELSEKPAQYIKKRLLEAIENNTGEADGPSGHPEPPRDDSTERASDVSPCTVEQRVRIYVARMQAHRTGFDSSPVHNQAMHANGQAEPDFALNEGNDIKQWWYDDLWSWDPDLWTSVEPHLPGPDTRWGPAANTAVDAPPIEPLASHVPEECFYVRFSDFKELLWFLDNAEFVSDVLLRSGMTGPLADETGSKIVRQLALERLISGSAGGVSQYSEVASHYVRDVAVIGTDPFFQEGPAMGLVIETPQQELVVKIVRALRGDGDPNLLKSGQGLPTELITTPLMWFLRGLFGGGIVVAADPPSAVTVEPLQIEGHDVYPYPSNPDRPVNPAHMAVRSYLVADGNFVLLTNCAYLVRRFLQAGYGQGALDALPEFHAARCEIPSTPPVGCFAFLSDQFYENARSPQYLIETRRRAIAAAELEMVQLAVLAARSEGKPCETVDQLVLQEFLPKGIGSRAGSCPEIVGNAVRDSLRGLRGTFVPVPDVRLKSVWDFEAQLAQQAAGVLPPSVWLSITRTGAVDGQVGIQVTVGVPFTEKSAPLDHRLRVVVQMLRDWELADHPAELLPLLAEPSRVEMSPVAGDLATLEIGFSTKAARTFAALRDWEIPFSLERGRVVLPDAQVIFAQIDGYIGETSADALLGRLLLSSHELPDTGGFAKSKFDKQDLLRWAYQGGSTGYVVFAPRKKILQLVVPELTPTESATRPAQLLCRPAQLRFRLSDPSQAKLTQLLRAFAYVNARCESASRVQLLRLLMDQFGLDSATSRAAAERLLGTGLTCPLGGSFEYGPPWQSTAWPELSLIDETRVPDEFRLPFLDDLHALQLDVAVTDAGMIATADVNLKTDYFAQRETDRARAAFYAISRAPASTEKLADLRTIHCTDRDFEEFIDEEIVSTATELFEQISRRLDRGRGNAIDVLLELQKLDPLPGTDAGLHLRERIKKTERDLC